MRRALITSATALALCGVGGQVQAAEFSWSGAPSNQVSPYRSNLPFGEVQSRVSFGAEHFRALDDDFLSDVLGFDGSDRLGADPERTLQVYSGFTVENAPGVQPSALVNPQSVNTSTGRLTSFGAAWSQRLSPVNAVGLSAGYNEFAHPEAGRDMLDTHAAMSWTSKWSRGLRPGVTGSVFLGDEVARDSEVRGLGRRYYGFSVGGEVTVFDSHTPYINYRLQRSLLDTAPESLTVEGRAADHSLVSAGWRWQLQRNFSLQAEATYSLSDNGLDLYNQDRSRLMFGTRFDFR